MSNVLLLRTFKGISIVRDKKNSKNKQAPFAPPLSLLYIASSLIDHGHNVDFIEVTCESKPEIKIQRYLTACDIVIINLLPGNQAESESLAQFIRKIKPEIPIIIQGLYCTINQIKALNDIPSANICIQGEAEHIINDLVMAIQGKVTLCEIPGILYRDNKIIRYAKPAITINDLDKISFPARHLVKNYDYGKLKGIYLCKPKFTSIITSRGCPNQCRFCTTRFINGPYRQRSADNVFKEIKEINDNYNSVMIEDDNFLADKKRAHKIFDRLIEHGIEIEMFIAGARVDSADESLYKKMAKSGVKFLSFGIESGNQEILNYYNKNVTISQIKKAVKLAVENDIITWGNFIFGAPIETIDQMKETLDFSLSLPIDIAFYRHLSYQRGSKLWKEALSNNFIDINTNFQLIGYNKTESLMTKEEISKFCNMAFKRFYIRPSYILREIFRSIKRNDFTILRSLYSAI